MRLHASDEGWSIEVATIDRGAFHLYDEEDWSWLGPRIVHG